MWGYSWVDRDSGEGDRDGSWIFYRLCPRLLCSIDIVLEVFLMINGYYNWVEEDLKLGSALFYGILGKNDTTQNS